MSGPLTGYLRADGRAGARNHVLVLPSVVCSTHAAGEIARGSGAIALTHQHGCLHVGDDLRHTDEALRGLATNPNVGGVVVVGLGCETIQGRRLARRIGEARQRVRFVGIQQEGGTAAAVARGRFAVTELTAQLAVDTRAPLPTAALLVGIEAEPDDPLVPVLRGALEARGVRTSVAPWSGAEGHAWLAAAGAGVIVSLLVGDRAPMGAGACPLLAVGRDHSLFEALRDDFDMAADGPPTPELAAHVADAAVRACAGEATAAERRGAHDFVLRRLAITM